MRARTGPPAVRLPPGSALATARPTTAGGGGGGNAPRYVGVAHGRGAGSLTLAYPPGTAVGDLAVLVAATGHNLGRGDRPEPFLTPIVPYAGTGPYPYAYNLDPVADVVSSSWGVQPYDAGGLARDGRRVYGSRTVESLSEGVTLSLDPGAAEIVGFLVVFADATTRGFFDGGWSDHTLSWTDASFGAEPPYAWPKEDYAVDGEFFGEYQPAFAHPAQYPFFVLLMMAPALTRSAEGVDYPNNAVPPATYTGLEEVSASYDVAYDPIELLASDGGAALYVKRAAPGQDPATHFFSGTFFKASAVVLPSPYPFTGYKYSYLPGDPIYWDYMHQRFRFHTTTVGLWNPGTVTGGAAANPRAASSPIEGRSRYQRFAQRV